MPVVKAKKPRRKLCPLKGFEPFTQMVRHIAVAHKITLPEVLDKFGWPGISREFKRLFPNTPLPTEEE